MVASGCLKGLIATSSFQSPDLLLLGVFVIVAVARGLSSYAFFAH